jgi:hypothetical protein
MAKFVGWESPGWLSLGSTPLYIPDIIYDQVVSDILSMALEMELLDDDIAFLQEINDEIESL